jgi:DNA uptake protein ComE-like DNA-binding protein
LAQLKRADAVEISRRVPGIGLNTAEKIIDSLK